MIKKCNFKEKKKYCKLIGEQCPNEEHCILFQIYNNTHAKPKSKPKKPKKPLQKTKDGKFRNPNRAMKHGITEIIRRGKQNDKKSE